MSFIPQHLHKFLKDGKTRARLLTFRLRISIRYKKFSNDVMSIALQVGNQTITAEEIIPLLAGYQLMPQLVRELIIDRAIASIECTDEEIASACDRFFGQQQITCETELCSKVVFAIDHPNSPGNQNSLIHLV